MGRRLADVAITRRSLKPMAWDVDGSWKLVRQVWPRSRAEGSASARWRGARARTACTARTLPLCSCKGLSSRAHTSDVLITFFCAVVAVHKPCTARLGQTRHPALRMLAGLQCSMRGASATSGGALGSALRPACGLPASVDRQSERLNVLKREPQREAVRRHDVFGGNAV